MEVLPEIITGTTTCEGVIFKVQKQTFAAILGTEATGERHAPTFPSQQEGHRFGWRSAIGRFTKQSYLAIAMSMKVILFDIILHHNTFPGLKRR